MAVLPDVDLLESLIGKTYDPQNLRDYFTLADLLIKLAIRDDVDLIGVETTNVNDTLVAVGATLNGHLATIATEVAEIKQAIIDLPGPP